MRIQPKPITRDSIPAALEKAHRYRLLNDPEAAESICLDVLAVDPENQTALVTQVLTITDQLATGRELPVQLRRAREVLTQVTDEYKRAYYSGIVAERHAMALIRRDAPMSAGSAYDSLRDAMEWFEKAEAIRPAGNDDSILRWNTCARVLARYPDLEPSRPDEYEPSFE